MPKERLTVLRLPGVGMEEGEKEEERIVFQLSPSSFFNSQFGLISY